GRRELRCARRRSDHTAQRFARKNRMTKSIFSIGATAIVVLGLAAVPWIGSDVVVQFGINTLLLAVLAQSWNIIGGYCGYASFGHSTFYGLGSYGVAIAMAQWNLPFAVGMCLGAALAVIFAV